MDTRLRAAAEAGDINEFYSCIRQDRAVLTRIDKEEFIDTPLHIAAARGHSDFAMAVMYLKPSFGQKLNQDVYCPIHLALQNGHIETVLRLLEADKHLVRVKGREGYTAFHYAAQRDNLDLLTRFLKDCPECIDDVTIRKESALHIAAQNERFGSLELLVRWLQRAHIYGKMSRTHLLNCKDRDGNTVLHIAASKSQPQMMKLLLECKADTKAINMGYLTALDIIENQEPNHNRDICLNILRCGGGLKASSIPTVEPLYKSLRSKITLLEKMGMGLVGPITNMSVESINAFLVGLTLIITAIFSSVLSPPGGVWQGDISMNATSPVNARVGNSVMDPTTFKVFFVVNFVAFCFTCCTIVVLLQIATTNSIIAIVAEVLASLLTCSFLGAARVIVPDKADFLKDSLHFPLSKSLELKLAPLFFLSLISIMEGIRRLCLICKRRNQEL
ncbi:hypothetical protein PTKIN_Ptkin16aG0084700 [Pterospermum kingtungense]